MGSLARMTRPYRAAIMDNNWVYVKKFYEKHLERLGSAVTLNGDTALHLAVYTRNMVLLQALLDIIKEEKGLEIPIYKDKRSRFPAKDNQGQTAQEVSELPVFDHDEVDEHLRFQATDYHGQTALHLAAIDGNLKALQLLLEYDEKLLTVENNREETPLFLAATFGKTKAVKYLAAKIKDRKPHIKRKDGTSILHIAILGEYFETAVELLKWILSRDTAGQNGTTNFDELAHMVDENGMTGLQLLASMPTAFKSGYRMGKFKTLLYYCLPDVDYAETYDKESDRKSQDTSSWNKVDLETGNERENQQTENCPSAAVVSRVYNTFWRYIARVFPNIQKVWNEKKKHNQALKLTKILAETDISWRYRNTGGDPSHKIPTLKDELLETFGDRDFPLKHENLGVAPTDEKEEEIQKNKSGEDLLGGAPSVKKEDEDHDEAPFIAAARNGILEIVKAILDVYPQAIEHVNVQNENIFHVAAKHRRAEILDFLQSSSNIPISRLKIMLNVKTGDSILHNAAYLADSSSRERPGEALLMQSDLQWFKRIEKIVPKYFINHRNQNKLAAQELFTEEHKMMVQKGQEWLRRTAEACTIVAVLIATVAFTCAYTVPGGSTDTGHPLLLKATPFSVFATSDALSLCFSLTSVVVFLSIMTSKMNEQDFRRSLPLKLVLGLTTLFLSVAFMMVAFSATLLLMIRQRLHWAAIPIYTIACFPVTIFLILQFPLYLNISLFTLNDFFTAK